MTTASKVRRSALSVKAGDVGSDGTFTGYGSVFGVEDSYGEIVSPGAFAESLANFEAKGRQVPILWGHNWDKPIGVYSSIEEDDVGLRVEGRLLIDEVRQAAEAHALMKAGAVTGLSIGYYVIESERPEKTGPVLLTKLDLIEVSLVTFPANDAARVDAIKQSLQRGEMPTLPEFEKLLRDAGFSKRQAATVASHGFAHLLRSDSASAPGDNDGMAFLKALHSHTLGG